MKMAKASEADLKMAIELAQMLEGFERGHFPLPENAEEAEDFDCDDHVDCVEAMHLILDILQRGSLFRVVFGMSVLLDPKNEAIDHSLDYLEHHPKVRMHDELVAAARMARKKIGANLTATDVGECYALLDRLLAKVEAR